MVEQAAHHGPQNENKILQLTAVTTLIMKKKTEIDFFFNTLFFVKKTAYNNIIIHIGYKQYYTFISMNELRMEIHVWITCLSSQQMNR